MLPKFKSIDDLKRVFSTEKKCIKYLEKIIWNGKPVSPHDPTSKVWKCANNQYKCKNTGKRFNVKARTIFENSKIPLKDWFLALHLFYSHAKPISTYQLTKHINVNQTTAWFMLHRLRRASDCPIFKTMLKDFVEADEAFIGGSNPNRHWGSGATAVACKELGRNYIGSEIDKDYFQKTKARLEKLNSQAIRIENELDEDDLQILVKEAEKLIEELEQEANVSKESSSSDEYGWISKRLAGKEKAKEELEKVVWQWKMKLPRMVDREKEKTTAYIEKK